MGSSLQKRKLFLRKTKYTSSKLFSEDDMTGKCHCGEEGVVFLHYAEKHLCADHFIRMFDRRFRKTVRMNKMLKKGDKVAVGLSGGKDSTVLLHSLAELREDLPFDLIAITIDEGIAGYREKTMVPAKNECEKL